MQRRAALAILAGAAVALPHAVRGQQKKRQVIGFLAGGLPFGSDSPLATAFHQGLNATGYVEGENVTIEYRWAEGQPDRLAALAADLVARKADVIVTAGGTPSALAAKNATSTIPIVFVNVDDPVGRGLVASLARPGGKVTGMNTLGDALIAKRLELLTELVPKADSIALLVNSGNPLSATQQTVTFRRQRGQKDRNFMF